MGTAPLSPALLFGDMLFISGQVGIVPETGQVAAADVAGQMRQALNNFAALLDAAGFALNDVVKTTVFLVDLSQFDAMNAVYRETFAAPFPARSTVGVALSPPSLLVEIEGIAVRGVGQRNQETPA